VIRLAVSLRPELQGQAPGDATLFVFAKAASGPPMPLAVYRGRASELPREVRLDDSMAMMPALKLSGFEQWTVTARVTRAGGVQAMSGDLQGSLTVARKDLGDAALSLVIDQVVP
jgi:cytochrome c-type biogenesis protein CcmH